MNENVDTDWASASGLSIRATSRAVWATGSAGAPLIPLDLVLRNDSGSDLTVVTFDTVRVLWRDATGTWVQADAGRNATSPGTPHIQLAPGAQARVDRGARATVMADRTIEVTGTDGFGGLWSIRGQHAGDLWIRLEIDTRAVERPPDAAWTGVLSTPPLKVRLVETTT